MSLDSLERGKRLVANKFVSTKAVVGWRRHTEKLSYKFTRKVFAPERTLQQQCRHPRLQWNPLRGRDPMKNIQLARSSESFPLGSTHWTAPVIERLVSSNISNAPLTHNIRPGWIMNNYYHSLLMVAKGTLPLRSDRHHYNDRECAGGFEWFEKKLLFWPNIYCFRTEPTSTVLKSF